MLLCLKVKARTSEAKARAYEAKAKNLTFEAKAEDLTSEATARPRTSKPGLEAASRLCWSTRAINKGLHDLT